MLTQPEIPVDHAGPRRPFAAPVLASAALGAVFGFLYPATHVAIEPAQILAGLVSYPSDNAFWLYQTHVWTVLHQLFALLLAIGIDERTLTQAVSMGTGALNFAALAAFARALGAPPGWSAAAPFLLWALNPLGWGQGYPILLIGHPHTYGMVGLAWVVLACSALGAGRFALGGALLGFAPALHPSVGASMAALTGICVLLDWNRLRPALPALLRGGVLGAALAAASLALHLWLQPAAPVPDAAAVARLFPVYLAQWDAHRQPLDWNEWRTWLPALGVAIAAAWLHRDRGDAARALLLRVFLASAIFGVLFALVRQLAPPEAIPELLLAAMPTRLLNFPVITFVSLLVAALTRDGASRAAQVAAVGLAAIALVWQWAHGLETWACRCSAASRSSSGCAARATSAGCRAPPASSSRSPSRSASRTCCCSARARTRSAPRRSWPIAPRIPRSPRRRAGRDCSPSRRASSARSSRRGARSCSTRRRSTWSPTCLPRCPPSRAPSRASTASTSRRRPCAIATRP